jgi:hypothetical protein
MTTLYRFFDAGVRGIPRPARARGGHGGRMSTPTRAYTEDELDACARALDAALWPILDPILARAGLTRDQAVALADSARPQPPAEGAGARDEDVEAA